MSGDKAPVPIEVLVSNALGKGVHLDALAERLAKIERAAKSQPQPQPKKAGD